MCRSCWEELYDAPSIVNDRTRLVAGMVRTIYENPGGDSGCCLHVTADDFNIEDSSVEFCRAGLGRSDGLAS